MHISTISYLESVKYMTENSPPVYWKWNSKSNFGHLGLSYNLNWSGKFCNFADLCNKSTGTIMNRHDKLLDISVTGILNYFYALQVSFNERQSIYLGIEVWF